LEHICRNSEKKGEDGLQLQGKKNRKKRDPNHLPQGSLLRKKEKAGEAPQARQGSHEGHSVSERNGPAVKELKGRDKPLEEEGEYCRSGLEGGKNSRGRSRGKKKTTTGLLLKRSLMGEKLLGKNKKRGENSSGTPASKKKKKSEE